ncbi:TetR/AcrR family transcriptional regulator [Amycolatopsis jejuensis]|uniref:TetR/AcrR family transcriptional regulator n=1 Tax=Amycolatopsis jejuensis TaxID=330084 RepID=UPI00068D7297|nr:TetR/AcrR family transcriptional regulator [Amycolatopsis jejuensis]
MSGLRDERTRQSREMILSAAAELFAEQGYQQTSLIDVANRSGVSRGSIPWHFGDKQGLLVAVVDHIYDEASSSRAAAPLRPGPEGAHDLAHMATRAIRSRTTQLMLALLLEASQPESPIHESFIKLHDNFRSHVSEWARQPDVASLLPDGVSPDALAVMVFGTVIGVNQQWNLSPDRVDLTETYEVLTRMLLSLLGRRDG